MTTSGGGLTGQWLGDYQLQGLLAVGGMAEVYRARDAVINREVAVKVLPLALAADPATSSDSATRRKRLARSTTPTSCRSFSSASKAPFSTSSCH